MAAPAAGPHRVALPGKDDGVEEVQPLPADRAVAGVAGRAADGLDRLTAWGVAALAAAPVLAAYALHFLCVPAGFRPTGFLQYDQPYYMANAQAVAVQGFSPLYGLPFSADPATPAVYFQPVTWLLGLLLRLTGADPGWLYAAFGAVAAIAMFRVALSVVAAYLPLPWRTPDWLAVVAALWGGGAIVALGVLALHAQPQADPWQALFTLDPFDGYWFLNLGRNAWFATEAFYHVLFLAAVVALLRRHLALAVGLIALLAMSHPFSGLELIMIVSAFAAAERALHGPRAIPAWFLAALAALLVAHLGYYLVALNLLSPEHRQLQQQWSLAWLLPPATMLAAYGPALALAVWRLRRSAGWLRDPRQAPVRLAVIWFLVALLLAKHELFVAPRQPLHFTRGYVWTPLALLALPLLRDGFCRLLQRRVAGMVGAALLLGLALADNLAWVARADWRMVTHHDDPALLLSAEQSAVLRRLAAPDMRGRLLLSDDPTIGYLATVYGPLRSWLSHAYNTPGAALRRQELVRFFATGDELPAWRRRDLVVCVEAAAPALLLRLFRAGFRVDARIGDHVLLLLRDADAPAGQAAPAK